MRACLFLAVALAFALCDDLEAVPEITFHSPEAGEEIHWQAIKLNFTVANFNPGEEGLVYLVVDEGTPEENYFYGNSTEAPVLHNLKNGPHTVTGSLRNLANETVSEKATVEFSVDSPVLSLELLSPQNDEILYSSSLRFEFAAHNFSVPDEAVIFVSLGEKHVVVEAQDSFIINNVTNGRHTLLLFAVDARFGHPLLHVAASINVTVDQRVSTFVFDDPKSGDLLANSATEALPLSFSNIGNFSVPEHGFYLLAINHGQDYHLFSTPPPFTIRSLPPGTHCMTIAAVDLNRIPMPWENATTCFEIASVEREEQAKRDEAMLLAGMAGVGVNWSEEEEKKAKAAPAPVPVEEAEVTNCFVKYLGRKVRLAMPSQLSFVDLGAKLAARFGEDVTALSFLDSEGFEFWPTDRLEQHHREKELHVTVAKGVNE